MAAPSPRRARRLRAGAILAALVATAAIVALLVVPACSDDGDDTLSTAEFCARLADQQDLIDVIGNLETTQLTGSEEELASLADQAPEAIRGDMATLAEAVSQVVAALEEVESGDVSAAEDAIRPLQQDLAEAQEAGTAVEAYARDTCGLDLRSGSTVATTVPTTPATGGPPGTGTPTTAPPGSSDAPPTTG